jgi:hypothetical protein
MFAELALENSEIKRRFRPKVVTPAAKQAAIVVMANDYGLLKAKVCKIGGM